MERTKCPFSIFHRIKLQYSTKPGHSFTIDVITILGAVDAAAAATVYLQLCLNMLLFIFIHLDFCEEGKRSFRGIYDYRVEDLIRHMKFIQLLTECCKTLFTHRSKRLLINSFQKSFPPDENEKTET